MLQLINISPFAGSDSVKEKVAGFEGDPARVREVVERSIAFVQHYTRLVGSGDFAAAYALTEAGLRAAMSFKKFVGEHESASAEYGGPALEFRIGEVAYVLADERARRKSNTSAEGWFKGTAKEARRSRVIGFWIRDRSAQTGCGGGLWIAAEDNDYRIAKFDFWRP
jgi:hypothetical protein